MVTFSFAVFLVHFGDPDEMPALIWTGALAVAGLLCHVGGRRQLAALAAIGSCLPVPIDWFLGGAGGQPWLPVSWEVLATSVAVAVWPLRRVRAYLLLQVGSFVAVAAAVGGLRLAVVPLAAMAVAAALALMLGAELSDLQAAGAAARERSRHDVHEATVRAAASEELYRSVFDSARDAILIHEAASGRVLAANARAGELYGMPAAQLAGRDVAGFAIDPRPDLMADLQARGYVHDVFCTHRVADGGERRLLINASLIRYQGREAVLSVLTDVTCLHALQDRLRSVNEDLERTVQERTAELERSRNLFASLAAGAPAAIVRADADGRWTWASARWTELTGLSAEASLGDGWRAAVADADRPAVTAAWEQAIRDGGAFRVECRLGRPRASGVAWAIFSAVPDCGPHGGVHQYVGTVTDVSDLMQGVELSRSLVETLRESSRQWRQIFDAVPAKVVAVDADGRILKLNRPAAERAGLAIAAALGQDLSQLSPTALWESARDLAGEALRRGESVGRRFSPEPGQVWNLVATPVRDAQPAQAVLVARDISAEASLESALRRRERDELAAELLAGLAHELRNPLFAITAIADVLAAEQPGPEWAHLRSETTRLAALVERLLQQAEVRPGLEQVVELRLLLGDAVAAVRRSFPELELELRFHPRDLESRVRVDAQALETAVTALVRNACQHSPAAERVTVDVRVGAPLGGPRLWQIGVRDRGPGFPPALLERGPRPFYTTRRGAVGLGLTQALQIGEHLGGGLSLTNAAGGGALAVLSLRDRRGDA